MNSAGLKVLKRLLRLKVKITTFITTLAYYVSYIITTKFLQKNSLI